LGKKGFTPELAQKVIDSEVLAKQVVNFLKERQTWTPIARAEEICRNSFVGVKDAIDSGLILKLSNDSDLSVFGLVPFSEEQLTSAVCRGYILMAIPGEHLGCVELNNNLQCDNDEIRYHLVDYNKYPMRVMRKGYYLVKPALEHTGRKTYSKSIEEMILRGSTDFGRFTPLSIAEIVFLGLVYNKKYGGRGLPSLSGMIHEPDRLRSCTQMSEGRHLTVMFRKNGVKPAFVFESDDSADDSYSLQLAAGHFYPVD
jgi:hypothetical protein